MPLNSGKHIVEEIEDVRCSIVEKGATQERVDFLKGLLELNGYEVKILKEAEVEGQPASFTLGVTDLLFNPVVDVYKRRLKTKAGHKVTPAYWLQLSSNETEAEVNYWNFKPSKK